MSDHEISSEKTEEHSSIEIDFSEETNEAEDVEEETNEADNLLTVDKLKNLDAIVDDAADEQLVEEAKAIREELVTAMKTNVDMEDAEKEEDTKEEESEITIFDDIESDDPMLENDLGEKKSTVIGETTLNNLPVKILQSGNETETLNKDELAKRVEKAVENTVKKAKNKAATKQDEKIDVTEFAPETETYAEFYRLLNVPLYIPSECVKIESQTSPDNIDRKYITMDSYVQEILGFESYSWQQLPPESMCHDLSDMLLITKRMNKIFKYQFGDVEGTNFRVEPLTENCISFLHKYANLDDLTLEHTFIVIMLGKLEILLNTNINVWLKSDIITVTDDVLKAFKPDIQDMIGIQSQDQLHHISKSWNTFVTALFNLTTHRNLCFNIKTQGYEILNQFLYNSYCYDNGSGAVNYQMEELIGNTLKMYSNSVIQSFFYAIRTLYIMIRLVSIYIQGGFKSETVETIAEDLLTIASFAVILYEHKFRQSKAVMRTPSKVSGGKELSANAQLFIDNYLICGGQYFLLKAVEKALPSICYRLV